MYQELSTLFGSYRSGSKSKLDFVNFPINGPAKQNVEGIINYVNNYLLFIPYTFLRKQALNYKTNEYIGSRFKHSGGIILANSSFKLIFVS